MASSVASASSSRSRMLWVELRRFGVRTFRFTAMASASSRLDPLRRTQVQPDQRALGIGKIADQLADRLGKFADQGGNSEDLIAPRQLRVLQKVDHLDAISTLQMLLANLLQVGQSHEGPRRLTGDVEAELKEIRVRAIFARRE